MAILGSTGSIGRQALDVAAAMPGRVKVVALAANCNHALLARQAREFDVGLVALADEQAAQRFNAEVRPKDPFTHAEPGSEAVASLADAGATGADLVLNALVGAVGLRVSMGAVCSGATLALANKESLVVAGELIMPLVDPGRLLPVDSEHSAIFQCLVGENRREVERIWLTASGGPFNGLTREELSSVTAEQALSHPTWRMGSKITIDSATLMNKGLEVIEAHHLFDVAYDAISVVVHPQSCVHSMVEFTDGSVKAHLGATDMRVPIQYAFSYPARWPAQAGPVDFTRLGRLDFSAPDRTVFGCFDLAVSAGRAGGTAPATLNAANEVAVAAFLGARIGFTDIERVVASVLDLASWEAVDSLEQLESIDSAARRIAENIIEIL
ncbi:MAG: 1-deoxy-D-xylulose-5-phosphate reductoisomerase [Coriobacteriia bacterium]|nr:1-deoxy-D-xylulose-5-phosphate reductoisomerase [Coriobacteriia bacterium]